MVRLERCVSRAGVPASGAGPAFPLTLLPGVPCPCPSVFWRDRAGIFFPAQAELWGDLDAGSSPPSRKEREKDGAPLRLVVSAKGWPAPPIFLRSLRNGRRTIPNLEPGLAGAPGSRGVYERAGTAGIGKSLLPVRAWNGQRLLPMWASRGACPRLEKRETWGTRFSFRLFYFFILVSSS